MNITTINMAFAGVMCVAGAYYFNQVWATSMFIATFLCVLVDYVRIRGEQSGV